MEWGWIYAAGALYLWWERRKVDRALAEARERIAELEEEIVWWREGREEREGWGA